MLILMVLIFFVISFSYSQTVDELVELAKTHNPQIKKLEKEIEVLRQKSKTAGKLPNPSFSFNIKDSGSFTFYQYIPWYEKLNIQKEMEEKRYELQQIVKRQELNRIIRQIKEDAFFIWFYKQKISINDEFLKKIDTVVENSKDEDGKNKLNMLKTELVLENQELELSISKLISDLKVLTNYYLIENVEIDNIEVPSMDEKIVRDELEKFSLPIEYIQKQLERDRLSYKLAKEIFMPDFGISITYKNKDRFQDAFSLGVNLFINVPLWRRLNQEQIVLEQKLFVIASQERRQEVLNQTVSTVERYISEYRYSKNKLSIAKNAQLLHSQDLERTTKAYIEGKENINSLLTSIEKNISLKKQIYSEVLNSNLSVLKIMEIIGKF